MTSWSAITLKIDKNAKRYTGPPTGLFIDKGNDEQGWVEGADDVCYALAYGRYQYLRYEEHVKNDFSSSWFNGVEYAAIVDTENTGDNLEITMYEPCQNFFTVRRDGMQSCGTYTGHRWPDEEREQLLDTVKNDYGFRPVVEPIETFTPPDAIVVAKGDSDE